MPEQRCLFCRYFAADEPNPAAEERALEMRYGPEVALVGNVPAPGASGDPEHEVRLRGLVPVNALP
jgi:hypothetical protein